MAETNQQAVAADRPPKHVRIRHTALIIITTLAVGSASAAAIIWPPASHSETGPSGQTGPCSQSWGCYEKDGKRFYAGGPKLTEAERNRLRLCGIELLLNGALVIAPAGSTLLARALAGGAQYIWAPRDCGL